MTNNGAARYATITVSSTAKRQIGQSATRRDTRRCAASSQARTAIGAGRPVVFLGNRFLSAHESPVVSLFDRGYVHGDAVFETVRSYHGKPFRLDAHLDRMFVGASALGIPCPLTRPRIVSVVSEAIRRTRVESAHVRVTLSRGVGGAGVSTFDCHRPVLSVVARPLVEYPRSAYQDGIQTSTVSYRSIPNACIPSSFKSANYLPSVLARRELDSRGQIEGLVLSADGELVGGTVSNVFLVRDGELHTPRLSSGCLPGVTRAAVLELSAALGIPAHEQRLDPSAVLDAHEVFFTNSVTELLPVRAIADRDLVAAPGLLTRRLHRALADLIDKEINR